MIKRKSVIIFCVGSVPTQDELELLNKYAVHNPLAINVKLLYGNETFSDVLGVAGAVPEHLKHLPHIDDALNDENSALNQVANTVGGKAPVFGKK